MTKNLAAQYRGSAFLLTVRLDELRAQLGEEENPVHRRTLEKRIEFLVEERYSLLSTAAYLEEYYEEAPASPAAAAV